MSIRLNLCKGMIAELLLLLCTTDLAQSFAIPDPIIHFSVGAVAGGAGAVAAYPLDYIKSQMQIERKDDFSDVKYENGLHALVSTVQDNPLKLYKGVGVQVMGIAPEKGIKLGVNDVLRTSFVLHLGGFPLWAQVLSGGLAGAAQVIATNPLEVLKVGLQTSDMNLNEVWHEVGGFRGLFRGSQACLLRDVLFTAVCFPLYNACVDGSMNTFVAGSLSGSVACFLATPPDFIKTRILSLDDLNFDDDPNPLMVAYQIAQEEGPEVFFSGVSERCIGAIPRFGTTLAMHDFLEHAVSHAGWLSS